MRSTNPRRLIDRDLFANRDMHTEMQEWIGLAEFGRVIALAILFEKSLAIIQ